MQSKNSIFVSRDLSPGSCFFDLAEKWSLHLSHRSLLSFAPLPFVFSEECDWLFFYSVRGVDFFCQKYPEVSDGIRLAAIGSATAKRVEEKLGRIDYQGCGDPLETLNNFSKLAKGQTIVFVRAKQSASFIAEKMRFLASVQELMVYDNHAIKGLSLPFTHLAVLTSSLTASVYLDSVQKPADYLVVIGTPTANYLKERGCSLFYQSEKSSEESLCQLCDKIIKENEDVFGSGQ